MIRGIFLILFALFIDGLQAGVSLGLLALGTGAQTITPLGGAITGATGGAYFCWNATSGFWAAISQAAQCAVPGGILGAAISAVGVPLAIGLGFAINICISLTMGAGLLTLMALSRMFYPGYALAVFVGEAIPGLDNLPGWTLFVVRSLLKKKAESGGKMRVASSVLGIAGAVLSPTSAVKGFGYAALGISALKATAGNQARNSSVISRAYGTQPVRTFARERRALASEVGREVKPSRSAPTLYAPSI